MALNFGLLDQGGPTNFFEGYRQADKEMQANAMAQQRAAQAQQEFGMRQQEFAAGQADKQRVAKAARVTQKLDSFEDALLRSQDPAAARRVVQMQYTDPDIGEIRSQFGSLQDALAEVPDEPNAFQEYLQREAMGIRQFRKMQGSDRAFQNLLARAKGGVPAAPAPAPVAAAALSPTVQTSIDDMVSRGIPREAITTGPEGQVYVGSYGSNVVGEPTMEQYRTPQGSLATRPQAPLTPLRVAANQMAPGPVNAMAPQAAPAVPSRRTPEQIAFEIDTFSESSDPRAKAMIARLTEEYKAALKPAPATNLSDRFVPVGRLVFDRQTQKYISPSDAQLAQSQERAPTTGPAERTADRAAQPKPLTIAQENARRDKIGKEFKIAQGALQTTQDVLDSIAFVKSEPGLARATGFTGTMLPSFPEGAAASADVRLANLKGKVTALGKAAAAASGAIGSIATVEWKILSDQIAAIDPVKGTGPLLKQLELIELQAQGAMSRIQDGYQRQFGEDFERFPQFSNLPPPKSATKTAPAGGAAPQGTGGFKYLGPERK